MTELAWPLVVLLLGAGGLGLAALVTRRPADALRDLQDGLRHLTNECVVGQNERDRLQGEVHDLAGKLAGCLSQDGAAKLTARVNILGQDLTELRERLQRLQNGAGMRELLRGAPRDRVKDPSAESA